MTDSTLRNDRGSAFLKRWMEFLEENADLRYPDVSSLALES
jgi:DNA polymerase alpha-associated DNA helicase A